MCNLNFPDGSPGRNVGGIFFAVTSVLLWSFSVYFIVDLSDDLNPQLIAGLRGLIAAPVVLLAMWVGPSLMSSLRSRATQPAAEWMTNGSQWSKLKPWQKAALVLLGTAAYATASHTFVYAARNANAGAATFFFFAVSPVFAISLEILLQRLMSKGAFGQRSLTRADVVAFLFLLIGLTIFSIGRVDWQNAGYFASFITAMAWGVCVGVTGRMGDRARYGTLALGTLATGFFAAPSYHTIGMLTADDWRLLIMLGVVALGLPLFFYGASLALVGRTTITMIIMTLQPIAAMFWVWLLANDLYQRENFQWWHYISAGLIVITVGTYNIVQTRKR